MRSAALVAAAATVPFVTFACAGRLQPSAAPARSEPASLSGLVQPEDVRVRIVRAEGRSEIALAPGPSPRVTFLRTADYVIASDGRTGVELALAPHPPADGVGFDGALYPGHMLVRPAVGGGLELVNAVALEDYVAGVVAAELSLWSALPAELEAQAIAVRTYALHTLAVRRAEQAQPVLLDSVEDQSYRGRFVPGTSAGALRAEHRLAAAVDATRGTVLVRAGRLEDARYHAACGGDTANLADVFAGAPEGPTSVRCEPCAERLGREREAGRPDPARPLSWEHTFDAAALAAAAAALGVGERLTALVPADRDAAGRWLAAEVEGPGGRRTVPLDDLRRALGFDVLKSSAVIATWPRAGLPITSGLAVRGAGRGHGVGLCQEGARDYAARGWTSREILMHYYPGAVLQRLPQQ